MTATNYNSNNTRSSSSRQTAASMLSCAMITALFASFVLSVDAIRCHQCNSHLDEDCIGLRLATPRAPRDNQYLRDCDGDHTADAFCRKTVTTLQVSGEQRTVRSCGWHKTDLRGRNDTCFEADNEGFESVICACFEDGCNAATPSRNQNHLLGAGLAVFVLLVAAARIRRSD